MTNKPMLSVERELLERAASAIEKHHGSLQWVIASELRALLDNQPKPAVQHQGEPVAVDAEILERFPEINFANYGQDEVEALQAWAFEAYEAIARLTGVKT